jgi:hypothetical protein
MEAYHVTSFQETRRLEQLAQAEGWLQGHWWLSRPVSEQVPFQGHYYDVHLPLSAVVMLAALKLNYPYDTYLCDNGGIERWSG